MRILLVAAPSESALSDSVPDRYKDLDLGNYPPLGLMYLASYLAKNSEHAAKIVDMSTERLKLNDIVEIIKLQKPRAVGFYTTSFNINRVYEAARLIKDHDGSIVTVLGGPHVELFPEDTASLEGVDFAVAGEGELTLTELLNCIEQNGDPASIRGVAYKDNGRVRVNPPRPMIDNLDVLPLPDRKMTDYKKYYSLIGRDGISTTLMTSRGCPYRCNFCFIQYGGRCRSRSVENVLAEIDDCVKLGIGEFFIFDEIFTLNKARVMEFCQTLVSRRYDIVFDIRSRIDTIDEEMLAALKAAGCARIQYGIESGSDEILKAMNKGITVRKAREVVGLTKKAGIEVLLDFMLGYPGETKEDIEKTVAFAKELDTQYVQFGVVTYFPGIKIYTDALKSGAVKEDFWRNVAKSPPAKIVPPFASEIFTRAELERFLHDAYISYYFRPGYILKALFKIHSPLQLLRQLRAGYHLVSGK